MKVENIAKTYNTLTKYIRDAIFCIEKQNRVIYKVKNKFYFINEKDNTCKCICEVDSSFLECMDTNLKENVIFSDFIDSDYDIETQLKELQESENEHIFAIFDSIVAEIDRQDLLENDFFKFCIHQIEKENNIVYSENEIDSSIDTNMQEADTEPTETKAQIQTDFNAEHTEPSIKDNETQLEKLKEVIFEAIKQENTESIARKDFSNKASQNIESKQKLDLRAKKQTLLTFSMKNISLSHKQHKSLTDYKHINSFNSVIEKRIIKAIIAKERSPPLHKGA